MLDATRDKHPRKCVRCRLTTFKLSAVCDSCERIAPEAASKWYSVVMTPSKLTCTFRPKHKPCNGVAVAVEHRAGMTGKAACASCIRHFRISASSGKGGSCGGHSIYKIGTPKNSMYRHEHHANAA